MNGQLHPDDLKVLQRMHRVKMAFFGLVILTAGMVIGGAVGMMYAQKHQPAKVEHGPEVVSRWMVERVVEKMKDELQLTDQQQAELQAIMKTRFKEIDTIRKEAQPKIIEQMNEMNLQIAGVLNEQQYQQWQEGLKQLREKFPGHPDFMRGGRGGRGGQRRGPEGEPRRPRGEEGPERQRQPEFREPPLEQPPVEEPVKGLEIDKIVE